jgi:hypothetical protein
MSYVRVSILGSAPNGEVWSINPVFDPTGEFPGGVNQSLLDAAGDAIAALTPGTQLMNLLSTALSVTGVRVEVRDDVTDGLIGITVQQSEPVKPGTGNALRGTASALVFSLRTDTPGGSGRGRLYWPAVGQVVGTDTRFSSANTLVALQNMATYMHAIEDALATAFPTIGFDLSVRSRQTHTTPHVTKMAVGNIIDTQRRRRDKMLEDYQTVTF